MDKSKLVRDGFVSLPDWKDAVLRYSEELKKEGKLSFEKINLVFSKFNSPIKDQNLKFLLSSLSNKTKYRY